MQRSLETLQQHKAQLIATSPLTMEKATALKEKHALTFLMTVDSGNKAAHQFGLSFSLSDPIKTLYEGFGINIAEANGDSSFSLPIPATYIIDTDGTIKNSFVNVDHTRRLDPEDIIATLKSF